MLDLGRGAWLRYEPHWLDAERADALLGRLLARDDWQQVTIVALGKPVLQPRLTTWAGQLPYRYSSQTLEPRPWDADLAQLRDEVVEAVGQPFNHVLLNLYRDGSDRIGRHADNEPELGRDPVIAAVSVGAPRRFELLRKGDKNPRRKVVLEHGSLLVMGGTIQHHWRHQIPRQPSVTQPRVNLTFRQLLRAPPE